MTKGMIKGSQFERQLCRDLSLWWTEGGRDDVFWRTSGSGSRATRRGRDGKNTHGQYGDIMAVDPIGEPLIDCFTIEIKRGYSSKTIVDALDKPGRKLQQWELWLNQVDESWRASGSYAWLLIHKRDQRTAVVAFPSHVDEELGVGGDRIRIMLGKTDVTITTLKWWLLRVRPEDIKEY